MGCREEEGISEDKPTCPELAAREALLEVGSPDAVRYKQTNKHKKRRKKKKKEREVVI